MPGICRLVWQWTTGHGHRRGKLACRMQPFTAATDSWIYCSGLQYETAAPSTMPTSRPAADPDSQNGNGRFSDYGDVSGPQLWSR